MKKHILEFIKRGLMAAGGGPIILSIVYFILGRTDVISVLTPDAVALGMISSAILAFIAGGITMIYMVERLSVFSAALIHGLALYVVYISVYLTNGWLKSQLVAIAVFTGIFILGYGITWLAIYICTKNLAKRLNLTLNKKD